MANKYLGLLALLLLAVLSAPAQVMHIQVVVHVVYNTPGQNISDAQIQSQIQVLNEDFNRQNADTVLIPQPFKQLSASADIQFCLAGTDPNGNITTGITRTQTSVTSFSTDNKVKFTAMGGQNAWNTARYLNIWICNLPNFDNGYATFPGTPSTIDGVVLDYRVVGRAPANPFPGPFNKGRRGTHEIAHYLNLQHIFGLSPCSPTVNGEWLPQEGPTYGCPTFPRITCNNGPAGDMFMNFMDMTDDACKQMFTPWQRAHMRSAIVNMRSGLLIPIACSSLALPGTIHQATGQVGQAITLSYYSPLNPNAWSWTLSGATPSASTAQTPSVMYTAAGNYDAALTLNAAAGTQTYTCQGCIQVMDYQVTGRVFIDVDQNGIFSAGDVPMPNYLVLGQPSGVSVSTDAAGMYKYYTNSASTTVSASPLPYHTVSPVSYPLTFNASGQIITNRDFALSPIPNQQDVAVVAVNSKFRYGYGGSYYLYIKNKGTMPVSGTVELQYDSNIIFSHSNSPVNVAGNVATWTYSNLLPWESRPIGLASFSVPVSLINVVDSLHSIAKVLPLTGDLFPDDNTVALDHKIYNSYDPNDKAVSHEILTPAQVYFAQPLTYTIRFQNTGNDTAFKVMFLDSLSTMLNLSTLEVLHASHSYSLQLNHDRRTAEWHFENIQLPDSSTNEPASHGFVQYRIRPNNNLALGDEIRNQAHIYFDFNEAVATNTTTTTVSLGLGTADDLQGPGALSIYPNPASDAITIESAAISTQPMQVTLYNTLGQMINTQTFASNAQRQELSLIGLPAGFYLVKVQQGDKSRQMRLVKQ